MSECLIQWVLPLSNLRSSRDCEMGMIYILLPASLVLAALALGGFIWAVKRGQFDDLDTPPLRGVFDDDEPSEKPSRDDSQSNNS